MGCGEDGAGDTGVARGADGEGVGEDQAAGMLACFFFFFFAIVGAREKKKKKKKKGCE